jgi:hypothetical protein
VLQQSDGGSFMQEGFLADLRALNPDVCITAAYGNFLPSKFLAIPTHGRFSFLHTERDILLLLMCIAFVTLKNLEAEPPFVFFLLGQLAVPCGMSFCLLLDAVCSDIGCHIKLTTWCWYTYRYSECSPQLASVVPRSCTRAAGSVCAFFHTQPGPQYFGFELHVAFPAFSRLDRRSITNSS